MPTMHAGRTPQTSMRLVCFLMAALILAVAASACAPQKNRIKPTPLPVGVTAPDFSLVTVNGEVYRLEQFRGKPMIVYFWPSMIVLVLCGVLQGATDVPPPTLGLVATVCLAANLLVIVTDLDQKKFLIALLVVALLGLVAWISSLKDLGLVSAVGGWVGGLDVRYSTDAYYLLGGLLWLLFLAGLIHPRFDYWRFEANEFVHYVQPWGRDQSIPRSGSTVTREVPDVLELLLTFGGGTLVVRREGEVVARIEHVPFLGRRMVALERLLGATRVKAVVDS